MGVLRTAIPVATSLRLSASGRLTAVLAAVAALIFSLAVGYAGAVAPWQLPAAALGGVILAALGLRRPAFFVCALVFVRPLLDTFSNTTVGVQSANPAGLLSVGLIALCAALPLSNRRLLLPRATVPFAVVVAVTAGSTALAVFNFRSTVGMTPVAEAVRVAALLALYVLAANVLGSPSRIRALVIVCGLSGVIPAVLGIAEFVDGAETVNSGLARISGPFNGPNPLGFYLAMTALVLIATPSGWLSARVRLLALSPMLIALVATYSRVGYVTFMVGLILLEGRRRKHVVALVVVVVAATVALVPTVRDRVFPQPDATTGQASYESFSWRIQNWADLLDKWTERPAVGFGTSTAIVVNPRRPVSQLFDEAGGYEAHNLVVRVLVEGGVALLLVYVWLTVALARATRRLSRERWELGPIVRLVTAMWIVLLIVGLGTDDPFQQTAVMFVLLALTGALEGLQSRRGQLRARAAERRYRRSIGYLPQRAPQPSRV